MVRHLKAIIKKQPKTRIEMGRGECERGGI